MTKYAAATVLALRVPHVPGVGGRVAVEVAVRVLGCLGSGPLGRLGWVRSWAVHGVELPFGDRARSWWVDESGIVHDEPIGDAEVLPGRYVLPGLVDAHAHPAVTGGPDGPVARDAEGTRATLVAWAETGSRW